MPTRARNIATIAITTALAGAIAASGFTSASASSTCTSPTGLSGSALTACIASLRSQADTAGKAAARADEAYLKAQHAAADAKKTYRDLSSAADRAALVAERSRARAAAVAAQLARTGGSVGQTTEVLLSGRGASQVLYHLSRMSEMTSDTAQLADDAKRDQAQAEDLRTQARLAADRLASQEQDAKSLYDQAKQAATKAMQLVAKAQEQRSPGRSPALVTAYTDLPSSASVAAKVIAFARAQIGDPYVFGAAGPNAWDCSGLTMGAFAAAGRNIGGHGVNVQYQFARSQGLLVPYKDAKPGDLLFYGSGDFYHVTMYSGGGNMIEAPYPGKAVREVPVRTADLAPMVARFTG
ncbi:C40 family peptidase [Amnibacterium sp.]|uniref:C40 family peptidase n=1 Tax=Amnibacterium sp. TaxID=1872496 RepID=UPI003F7C4369